MNNPIIYLRGLKHADYTVFCVSNGQKTYFDPIFRTSVPYSSGQQVKRSIIESIIESLNVKPSPTTFYWDVNKTGALKEGEVTSVCNPLFIDQLIGGWMNVGKGGGSKGLKRRSPLSISAMTALHPLLTGLLKENASFDRSDKPQIHKVIVRNANGNVLSDEQINQLLEGNDRSLYRKWIPENTRATGLYVYNAAIDLRRLFCVSTNQFEPEIDEKLIAELVEKGWKKSSNAFGECLVMPKEEREKVIPAIADALINWHITSNQARTFSLMETLAIAISDNANTLAGAIRAKLVDDGSEWPKAKPIVDKNVEANVYIALPCAGYVVTEGETIDALEKAKEDLVMRMTEFDYENQIPKK